MNDASKLAGKLLFSLKLFQSFHKGYSRISWKPTCPELVYCTLWFDEKNWRCVSFKLALRVFLVKSKVGDSPKYLGQIIKSSSISRHLTIFGHYICIVSLQVLQSYETQETIETWFLKRAVKLPKMNVCKSCSWVCSVANFGISSSLSKLSIIMTFFVLFSAFDPWCIASLLSKLGGLYQGQIPPTVTFLAVVVLFQALLRNNMKVETQFV